MKQLVISLILMVLTYGYAFAQTDSLSSPEVESEGYPIYAIGGLGITGSYLGSIFPNTTTTPAFALGAEIPFTKAHIWAFQLYSYAYFGKIKSNFADWEYDGYKRIGDNYYGQFALLGELKLYTSSIKNKIRVSLNLGGLISASETENFGLDFGIGVCYRVEKNIFTELSFRMNLGRIDPGGNSAGVPPLLMLNMYYNINK